LDDAASGRITPTKADDVVGVAAGLELEHAVSTRALAAITAIAEFLNREEVIGSS
jgi:hypothetical protein